ncbi:hypothetical protein PM082_000280 [Marasmius tenuissimus]|nr:hypothetical protein PM082_000280 [Marasmius tenuissimus]
MQALQVHAEVGLAEGKKDQALENVVGVKSGQSRPKLYVSLAGTTTSCGVPCWSQKLLGPYDD